MIDPNVTDDPILRKMLQDHNRRQAAETRSVDGMRDVVPNPKMALYNPPTEREVEAQAEIHRRQEIRHRSLAILKELHDRMPFEFETLVPILEEALTAANKAKLEAQAKAEEAA